MDIWGGANFGPYSPQSFGDVWTLWKIKRSFYSKFKKITSRYRPHKYEKNTCYFRRTLHEIVSIKENVQYVRKKDIILESSRKCTNDLLWNKTNIFRLLDHVLHYIIKSCFHDGCLKRNKTSIPFANTSFIQIFVGVQVAHLFSFVFYVL